MLLILQYEIIVAVNKKGSTELSHIPSTCDISQRLYSSMRVMLATWDVQLVFDTRRTNELARSSVSDARNIVMTYFRKWHSCDVNILIVRDSSQEGVYVFSYYGSITIFRKVTYRASWRSNWYFPLVFPIWHGTVHSHAVWFLYHYLWCILIISLGLFYFLLLVVKTRVTLIARRPSGASRIGKCGRTKLGTNAFLFYSILFYT